MGVGESVGRDVADKTPPATDYIRYLRERQD